MAGTLRKLIEVVGVESKVGKTRIAEIKALFEQANKVRPLKSLSTESPSDPFPPRVAGGGDHR